MIQIAEELKTADKLFVRGDSKQKLIDYVGKRHKSDKREQNRDSGRQDTNSKNSENTDETRVTVIKPGVKYRGRVGENVKMVFFSNDRLQKIVQSMVKAILGCKSGKKMHQCSHCPFHLEDQKHEDEWFYACGTVGDSGRYGRSFVFIAVV